MALEKRVEVLFDKEKFTYLQRKAKEEKAKREEERKRMAEEKAKREAERKSGADAAKKGRKRLK